MEALANKVHKQREDIAQHAWLHFTQPSLHKVAVTHWLAQYRYSLM